MAVQWKFPARLTSDGRVATEDRMNANPGRIRFTLSVRPGQRPDHQQYGSLLDIIEQDPIVPNASFTDAAFKLKQVFFNFASEFFTVTSIATDRVNSTPRTVQVTVNYESNL